MTRLPQSHLQSTISKILETRVLQEEAPDGSTPGTIIGDNRRLAIVAGDRRLIEILRLQPARKESYDRLGIPAWGASSCVSPPQVIPYDGCNAPRSLLSGCLEG